MDMATREERTGKKKGQGACLLGTRGRKEKGTEVIRSVQADGVDP